MFAYWTSSFIFDVLKVQVTVITSLLVFDLYETGYDYIYLVFIPAPFVLVLFSYVLSFCFKSVELGFRSVLAIHISFFYFSILVVQLFRLIGESEALGDGLNRLLKLAPSFPIASAIFYEGGFTDL
mmetsp:Transcript_16412/g.22516  ORF Transcript_16412/g.22516 Transcript_16412/m.22516 type:complete len:126 (+) Transcript_16412:1825-2202(+)